MSKTVLFLQILAFTLILAYTLKHSILVSDNQKFLNSHSPEEEIYPEQHQVTLFNISQTVYSGFFQVHESGSKLYYQLFSPPNSDSDNNIPVIIWLDGGPGVSSQFSNFLSVGPVKIKYQQDGKVTPEKREINWCEQYHCIFIDSPVGTGYSVPFNNYRVTSSEQYAQDLYQFLQKFYKKYTNLRSNPLYIAGESYAGHYIPSIAEVILKEEIEEQKINLEGIIIGSGLIDLAQQLKPCAELSYAASLSTIKDYKKDIELTKLIQQFGQMKEYSKMTGLLVQFILSLQQRSGVDVFNYRENTDEQVKYILSQYLNSSEIKQSFGVPTSVNYILNSFNILYQFTNDTGISLINKFKTIIPKVKVLIYAGQDDATVCAAGIWEWILNLPDYYFPNNIHIKNTKKQIWKLKQNLQIAGNVKILNNFYFGIIYTGSHSSVMNVPKSSIDMLTRFINNEQDWTK